PSARDSHSVHSLFFFITAPPSPPVYTLSLHDALPISVLRVARDADRHGRPDRLARGLDVECAVGDGAADPLRDLHRLLGRRLGQDRKSTRLNSSHVEISYAVFCLKKKKKTNTRSHQTK